MPAPTEAQVREFVANLRQRVSDARVVGIRADEWQGPDKLEVQNQHFRVALCQSPLHVREELIEAGDEGCVIVLTPVQDSDLGEDVLARFAKRRVLDIEPWRLVLDLFAASTPDPKLSRHTWLAEALVEHAPLGGYPAVPAGVLDAETVWRELQRRLLQLPDERPDAVALVRWAENAPARERYLALSPRLLEDVRLRIRETAGQAGVAMLDALELSPGTDLIALGLACRVLFDGSRGQELRDAAVRFERLHRQSSLAKDMALQWADAAERVLREIELEHGHGKVRVRTERADRLLVDIGAEDYLHLSPTSPGGFEQRLRQLARAIEQALVDRTALPQAEDAARLALEHRTARYQEARRRRVEMARRLLRWLHQPPLPDSSSLVECAGRYCRQGAFVDLTRLVLLGGDHPPELGRAYANLLTRSRDKREGESARFGALLAAAGATPPSDQVALVPVERIVERVVAPLASEGPVLLLVMDGLSRPVFYELLEALLEQGCRSWQPDRPDLAGTMWAALAALPSITEVSRTSLFSGAIRVGDAGDEKRAFSSHPSLRQVSRSNRPPVVFHKAELTDVSGRGLSPEVRDAITSAEQHVVGVVLNVVDDLLFKADQIQPRWTLETAPLLRELVDAARSVSRPIVITSDHGHLLDDDTAFQGREAGERWREDGGTPGPEEVRVEGARVLGHDRTSVIVPWSERTRYGARRNGYHGGASPQEMVLPLAVLSWNDEAPAGFTEAAFTQPAWWFEPVLAGEVHAPARPEVRRPVPAWPLLDVLEPARGHEDHTALAQPAWIDALLAAARYVEQKARLSGRGVPVDDDVRRLLAALAERGGKMTAAALSQRMTLPASRLTFLVAAMRRLLNVDGLPVLDVHSASDTIELNVTLLIRQFELPGS